MIEHCRFHISSSLDPYENLAKEEFYWITSPPMK